MHRSTLNFLVALILWWLLNDTFDTDNGLTVEPLCPTHHVLRDFCLGFGEDALDGCLTRAEDDKNDFRACTCAYMSELSWS